MTTLSRLRTLLLVSLVLVSSLLLGTSVRAQLPMDAIAQEARARHGVDSNATATIHEVIDRSCARCDLGAFVLRWPADRLEDRGLEFQQTCDALLAAQQAWLDWLEPAGLDHKQLRADLVKLRTAIKDWKPALLVKGAKTPGVDVLSLVQAPDAVVQASARLAKAMRARADVGPARVEQDPAEKTALRFYAGPTRDDFVQLLVLAGDLNPEWKSWCWADGIATWTQVWFDDAQLTSLQYAAPNLPPGTWKQGSWMNERDPDVMQQQLTQLATNQLLQDRIGERAPGPFLGGLSMNAVVDVYGQCNTRIDGDLRAARTEKREVFVPGGLSEGGQLATNSAETRWREDHGRGHFLAILRQSQKEGESLAKGAKFKQGAFGIRSDKGGDPRAAVGPFIGAASAATQAPPAQYLGDFAEFIRAYKCGFIHWLKSASEGSPKKSGAAFGSLLVSLATPAPEGQTFDFEAVFAKHFGGDKLSTEPLTKDTLEGRFLIWLSKHKG